MAYAIQVDHTRELELAAISAGGDLAPGDLVDKFDAWLIEEPAPVDREKNQLLSALGVAP